MSQIIRLQNSLTLLFVRRTSAEPLTQHKHENTCFQHFSSRSRRSAWFARFTIPKYTKRPARSLLVRIYPGKVSYIRAYTVPLAAGVFLERGVIGANGGGISTGAFLLLGVDGILKGRVPARGFLTGGSILSSCLLNTAFLA